MRGRDEHHKLRYGDLQLKTDENGTEYVEWCFERGTKTRNGEGTGCLDIRQFKPIALSGTKTSLWGRTL